MAKLKDLKLNDEVGGSGFVNNFTATINPTVNHDIRFGYSIGSLWLNVLTKTIFQCADATYGQAKWRQISQAYSKLDAIEPPKVSDDIHLGFEFSSVWFDKVHKHLYQCVDNTLGQAIWREITSPLNKLDATTAPTESADSSLGYEVKSLWLDKLHNKLYQCLDATPAQAIWRQISSPTSKLNATVPPTEIADSSLGYEIGSLWVDINHKHIYQCIDATILQAKWKKLSEALNKLDAVSAPTVNDDIQLGYEVGSLWIDTYHEKIYQCISAGLGAAQWKCLTSVILDDAPSDNSVYGRKNGTWTLCPTGSGGDLAGAIPPLQLVSGYLYFNYSSTNLQVVNNQYLDTIQPIATASTPTFVNTILTGLSNNYLPYKTASGFANSIVYTDGTNIGIGTTNLSYKLDVAGTGRFTQALQLDTQATATNHAVAGGRSITTSAPLTGGGDLTANRSIALSYDATNLKLTNNALDTIQPIHTGASPTFVTAKFTSLSQGYVPYHYSASTGLIDSPIFTNGLGIGVSTTTITEKLNLNGNAKIYGDMYSDNFVSSDPIQGYYIGRDGSVFNKITVGELHAKAFIADLEMALAGSQIIAKSVAKLAVTFDSAINDYLIVESFEGFPSMAVFENNDTVRLRHFSRENGGLTILDMWLKVWLATNYNADGYVGGINTTTKTQAYTFELISGSYSFSVEKGALVLDYGAQGNGTVETVAVSAIGGKPYSQIAEWTSGVIPVMTIRERHGYLQGITTVWGALTNYGFYSNNAFLEGNVYIAGNVWALTGGIGGDVYNPVVSLAGYGMQINNAGISQSLLGNSIMIGNIDGSANSAIKLAKTGSLNTSGLFGYNNSGSEIFALRLDGTASIAGWTIDTSQIYNSSVRLESSATLKGLGVKDGVSDVLKVGDFTNASETYATATMPNAPNPASAWTNEINVNNRLTWNSYGSNYGMASSNTDFTSYQWRTYLTLPINDIKGKTITISFGIAERESMNGSSKATNIWAYIKTDVGTFALMDVTPAGGVYLLGNTPTYETRTLTATIPSNATYARFYIAWYKNGAFDPADVLFNNWSFLIYNKTIVELNKTGLKIYNSPISKILLNNNEAVFNLPFVRASSGIQLGERWTLVVEPYLEGDGITLNERLTLKYNGVMKGFFSQTDGTYVHV